MVSRGGALQALLRYAQLRLTRSISSTPRLDGIGWIDKIKGVITGKPAADSANPSFSLIEFADQMDKARKLGMLKKFEVGRCSEATVSDAFKKKSSILRYLGGIDPSGQVQKLMGSTPLDVARSNLAKNGQISRNALCPCKSGKKYKRCCGMT